MRRLLECLNALQAAGANRPAILAERLLRILEATVVGIDADVKGRSKRLASVAAAPGLPGWVPVVKPIQGLAGPEVESGHEVTLLPTPAGASPDVRPAGIRSVLVRDGRTSAISAWREEPFEQRHAVLLQVFHPQIAWVFGAADARPGLPVAMEAVLELMLTGMPEREIAQRLGRSEHTVHGHVKRVYKHFDVRSRPELMARLYDGKRPVGSPESYVND